MYDEELLPAQSQPIDVRLRNGLFYADLGLMDEIPAESIEGEFRGITRANSRGYPYYALCLRDDSNEYQLLLSPTGHNICEVVRLLYGRVFRTLFIRATEYRPPPTIDSKRPRIWSRMRVYADDERLYDNYDGELPHIRRYRPHLGQAYRCDYSMRLEAIESLINAINEANGWPSIQPAGKGSTNANLTIFRELFGRFGE